MPSREKPITYTGQLTIGKQHEKAILKVLEQHTESRADAESKAKAGKGRLMSENEFISALRSSENYQRIGNGWHRLGAVAQKESGYCRIDYQKGELAEFLPKEKWDKLPTEQKAYVHGGTGDVIFDVGGCQDMVRLIVYVGKEPTSPSRLSYIITEKKQTDPAGLKRT